MKRQVDDTVSPADKVNLWTPWGVQRSPQPDRTPDEPRPIALSLGGDSLPETTDSQERAAL